jgi:hypothetical protein
MDVHTRFFVALLVGLILTSSPRATGDGGEYLTMALDLASFSAPSLAGDDVSRLRPALDAVDGVRGWDPASVAHPAEDGTRDFVHFWFYSALAAPFVRVATALGVSPVYGFAVLNLLLLAGAFWLAVPRIGSALSWLVLAGPALWWIDKPHTEIFTLALLSASVVLVAGSPGWAMVAAGVAATQNPPIAVLVPAALVAIALTRPALLRSGELWAGVAGAAALVGAHMLYYTLRHGTPFLLLGAARRAMPGLDELLVVPFDTNLGLFPALPALAVLVVAAAVAIVRRPRAFWAPDVLVSIIVLPVFLVSFAQTTNVHHGGTPGLSRYAVWLIPLTIPLLRAARSAAANWFEPLAIVVAIPSVVVSVLVFHPRHPDNYREPTALAQFLWTKYPALDNPLPEIFADVMTPRVEPTLPIALPSCEKVLLVGRGEAQGMWPMPCYPAEVPAYCRTPEALCYANLMSDGYQFAPTHDPAGPRFKFARDRTWTRAAESTVRKTLDELGWRGLQWKDPRVSSIAGYRGIEALRSLEQIDRLFIVAVRTGADPQIDLRLLGKVSGRVIDPETGAQLGQIAFRGGVTETVRLPGSRMVLILQVK